MFSVSGIQYWNEVLYMADFLWGTDTVRFNKPRRTVESGIGICFWEHGKSITQLLKALLTYFLVSLFI